MQRVAERVQSKKGDTLRRESVRVKTDHGGIGKVQGIGRTEASHVATGGAMLKRGAG